MLPLYLYLANDSILEHNLSLINDTHRLHLKLSLGLHLDHIPINDMIRIMYIVIKQKNMKKKDEISYL